MSNTGIENYHKVIDPNGVERYLTCTDQQLAEIWIPKGYIPVEQVKKHSVKEIKNSDE